MLLMDALRNDVYEQLVANKAEILYQNRHVHGGFRFEYKLGNSVGAITISPLQVDSGTHRTEYLSPGLVDVDARIEQEEKWFPDPPFGMTVRISDRQ